MSCFKSTAAGINGAGFSAGSLSLTQGQDWMSPQQQADCPSVTHDSAGPVVKHDCTWESWMTSPMSNAMIDLITITIGKITVLWEIPMLFPACRYSCRGSKVI